MNITIMTTMMSAAMTTIMSTITMTMRYAHFAPEHLDDAVRLNPLASPHS